MRKAEKMLIIFMIIICSFGIIPQSKVEATDGSISVSGIVKGIRPTDPTEDKYSDLAEVVGKILGFLQIASGITTVIMIAFLGFELITSMPETREANVSNNNWNNVSFWCDINSKFYNKCKWRFKLFKYI